MDSRSALESRKHTYEGARFNDSRSPTTLGFPCSVHTVGHGKGGEQVHFRAARTIGMTWRVFSFLNSSRNCLLPCWDLSIRHSWGP